MSCLNQASGRNVIEFSFWTVIIIFFTFMYKFIRMIYSVALLITVSPISYLPFDLHFDLRCYVFFCCLFLSSVSFCPMLLLLSLIWQTKLNNLSLFLADLACNFYQAYISDLRSFQVSQPSFLLSHTVLISTSHQVQEFKVKKKSFILFGLTAVVWTRTNTLSTHPLQPRKPHHWSSSLLWACFFQSGSLVCIIISNT